ncbi:MAG TPA: hypothetical protein VJ022_08690 [Anaerolineales bacterium]|nr:hypothetical protein [Anaerolineales bacterium]
MRLNGVVARSRNAATWESRGRWLLGIAMWRLRATRIDILILLIFLLTSCSPGTPQTTPEVLTVYSTSAAQPWLDPLYACASSSPVLSRVDDPVGADIILRVGEPEFLASPAYQIDTEEILIVTHRQSPVQNLTLEEARALFLQTDPSVQVWVYASEEDIQWVFDQVVMEGRSVTSSARVAVNPQVMSDTLVNQPNAVGILPRHWRAGDVRDVYSVATVPVLAITQNEPIGMIGLLIDCLQK